MSPRRSPLPASGLDFDVILSLKAEARRQGRPLAAIVADAISRYVVETDPQRDAHPALR